MDCTPLELCLSTNITFSEAGGKISINAIHPIMILLKIFGYLGLYMFTVPIIPISNKIKPKITGK
ncbi:hypothetical protein D3C78_1584060 [compost metagenome]